MPIDEQSDYPTKRIAKLREIDEGRVWWQLNDLYFSHMRNAYAVIIYDEPEVTHIHTPEPVVTPIATEIVTPITEPEEDSNRRGGGGILGLIFI